MIGIVECIECGEKMKFNDIHDIRQSKWKVLAWIVPNGDPRCVCNNCEYGKNKTTVQTK